MKENLHANTGGRADKRPISNEEAHTVQNKINCIIMNYLFCLHKCHLPCPYPESELEFPRRHSDDCSTAGPLIGWHFQINYLHLPPICE